MKNIIRTTVTAIVLALSSQVSAVPASSFLIDGNTFTEPFAFNNNSTAGEQITRFNFDLSSIGVVFDVITGGVPNTSAAVPFTPLAGTDITTGLTSFDVVDGGSILDIFFSDFNVGETFRFDIDIDFNPTPVTVLGSDLIGAAVFVDFSDGQRLFGNLEAVMGNADASQFVIAGSAPIPVVPLPAAAWLFGSALLGFIGFSRRKKQA